MIPIIYSENYRGDIYSKLFEDRVLTLFGPITDEMAEVVTAELLYLASVSDDDIQIYINSPGGSVSAGFTIYDVMQRIKPDVVTIASGTVASMAAVILSGGTKGKRYTEKHAEIMIHQPSTGISGQESDVRIAAEHIARLKGELNEILSKNTGKPHKRIVIDTERDYWMNADEALEYGIVDKILE